MPTNRTRINRNRLSVLDDPYKVAEALQLTPPLICGVGFSVKRAPNIRVRDEAAIAAAWRTHEATLLRLWIAGWLPGSDAKFTGMKNPGLPGTRPPGFWKYAAPEPRRSDESEHRYIARLDLWVEGEKEAFAARERRAKIIDQLAPVR